jgi:polyisoprenoid-binding protein YceI
MTKAILAALALLASTPASAAHWNVDYSKSRLGFAVQWSKEPFSASFRSWKAAIVFDPADLANARADVTIDLSSEASDEAEFDDGLKGAQGFAVTKFPSARFTTLGFIRKAANSYVAMGTLSLHGISRPVTLPFTLVVTGKTAHMTGSASVIRTDFGLGQGMWAGTDPVAHEVTVSIDLVATEQ